MTADHDPGAAVLARLATECAELTRWLPGGLTPRRDGTPARRPDLVEARPGYSPIAQAAAKASNYMRG